MTLGLDLAVSAAIMLAASPISPKTGKIGAPNKPFTIVAFGDSITLAQEQPENLRWTALLEEKLNKAFPERKFRVINAGVGGNTSREGLKRMAADVLAHKPSLALVQFGGNDATLEKDRHVSLEEFRVNLETMRDEIAKLPGAKMALLTFPPLIDAWHLWNREPAFREQGGVDACAEKYRKVVRDFAQANGLAVADLNRVLRAAIQTSSAKEFILNDGVHLRAQGHQTVADEVFRAIRPVVEELVRK